MSEINILSKTQSSGEHFLSFSIDGKKYIATPKKNEQDSWLNEFEELLKFSKKYKLNPYATPLKNDPIKADKYKKRRMFDRIKYSWNDDESLKEGTRKGLKHYIDIIPKENIDKYLIEKYSPETKQMKLKLSNIIDKLLLKNLSETAKRLFIVAKKIV
jgi:hypothetical protein